MITLQQQPTPYTCNQACLAMLLNEPVEKVIEVFPGDGLKQREFFVALDRCGFTWNALIFGTMLWDGHYVATVPSLNFEGGAHCVILGFSAVTGELKVFDPNTGRPGKKFYSTTRSDGVIPRTWSDLIFVRLDGRLPSTTP